MSEEYPPNPAAASPDYRGVTISALCSLFARPILLTGVLRDILIRRYARAQDIELQELRSLVWEDGDETKILIESLHKWQPRLTEHRPAIIIKRNPYANKRYGIGDKRQGPAHSLGHNEYSTYWTGSHTLFCIGGTGAQAELLATDVQRELTQFGPLIREELNLMQFRVLEVGEISTLEESAQHQVVPVVAGYEFEENWQIRQQAPLLNGYSLESLLNL